MASPIAASPVIGFPCSASSVVTVGFHTFSCGFVEVFTSSVASFGNTTPLFRGEAQCTSKPRGPSLHGSHAVSIDRCRILRSQ